MEDHMERLSAEIDVLVRTGIRAYIDLIGRGERVRSGRIFKDVLELSALCSGGPSRRVAVTSIAEGAVIIAAVVRSLLATLLVLRFSRYWSAVPLLGDLARRCESLGMLCETSGHASGSTSHRMKSDTCRCAGEACGCRRSIALRALPTFSDRSMPPIQHELSTG